MTLTVVGERSGFVVHGCDCGRAFLTEAGKASPKFCPFCRGAA